MIFSGASMEYRKLKDEDKDGIAVEDDVENLNGRPLLGAPPNTTGSSYNDHPKWKTKSIVTLLLTLLTSSQSILIVWSKGAGKYEYSVITANFSVEALKCILSLFALARIWRKEGVTEDNK